VAPAHTGEVVFGLAGHFLAGEHDRALVGLIEPGDQVEQGRLPAP
jgi:hypothetical protein